MTIDRRTMLGASAAALSWAALPPLARAAAAVPPAPVARVAPVTDTYFGDKVVDRYRWMENDKDPDWLPFLRAENTHARAVLDAIPGRDGLARRIAALSGDLAVTAGVQRAGGRLFFQQRPAGADNYKLFVRESGRDRVLVDPTAMSAAGVGHYSLDWWRASPDGAHLAYGVSKDGSEDSILHVMSVTDGRDLPERIADTQGAQPRWAPDGTGFFYTQLTGKVDTPERFLDAQARFHRLGTDPAADPILMKRGLDPAIAYDRIQEPTILTAPTSRWALLLLSDVRPEARAYVAPLTEAAAGRARWTPVAGFDDEVTDFELDGDDIYLVVNKGSPLGRVVKTSATAPSIASARTVLPEGRTVVEGVGMAREGLYVRRMDGGVGKLSRIGRDGGVHEIALPFDGTIGGLDTEPTQSGALMGYTGWLTPADVYRVEPSGTVTATGLTPRPAIDVSPYETFHGFATARDGVKVPYTLIFRKGLKRDGATPAWISAYGSYGAAAYVPAFAGKTLALVDAGFIVGYANVRGGGEYGRPWHKAGQHANKPNTWRDLIDVCETLRHDGWTSKARLAIGGRSAGGITVGRALTERPDLFAAVIDGVGWSNPLRYVAEQNGYGEEPEWGAIAKADEYPWLKAIDSYQAVKDGTPYPAVLLTTGVTDPRVAPFHVGKMAARLQAATSSGKPILLRVDYDAGHGVGSTRAQQDREAVDTYAFLAWRCGVAGFQPA